MNHVEIRNKFDQALAAMDIATMLQCIEDIKQDDESAHHMEKRLWEAVLGAIDDPKAKLALTSRTIEFSRWYA